MIFLSPTNIKLKSNFSFSNETIKHFEKFGGSTHKSSNIFLYDCLACSKVCYHETNKCKTEFKHQQLK